MRKGDTVELVGIKLVAEYIGSDGSVRVMGYDKLNGLVGSFCVEGDEVQRVGAFEWRVGDSLLRDDVPSDAGEPPVSTVAEFETGEIIVRTDQGWMFPGNTNLGDMTFFEFDCVQHSGLKIAMLPRPGKS